MSKEKQRFLILMGASVIQFSGLILGLDTGLKWIGPAIAVGVLVSLLNDIWYKLLEVENLLKSKDVK